MSPEFTPWAGWGGATLVVAGAETMQLGGTITGGSWILGPAGGVIGTLIGGGMFIAGGETAIIGIDIIVGAILAQEKNKRNK
jgi:hypothetical protein